MDAELIKIAKKAARTWSKTDAYHQAADIINSLVDECERQDKMYQNAKKVLETIMGSQKYCALCSNTACKNGTTGEVSCAPMWSGKNPW